MPNWIRRVRYDADTIRQKRNADRKKNYDLGRVDTKKERELYTEEEHMMIMAHEIPDRELALLLHRSVNGIQCYRCKHGKNSRERVKEA